MKVIRINWVLTLVTTIALAPICPTSGAQQAPKLPRIGLLTLLAKPDVHEKAFLEVLRELGYTDGQNIIIEYRRASGQMDRLNTMAEDLVRREVNIIVVRSTPVVQAAKNATTTIPIVMVQVADPVRSGFIRSLARPGGNITGISNMMPELAGKRLELLKETVPNLSRVAFLAHGSSPAYKLFVKEAQDAAENFGIRFLPVVIVSPQEMDGAFSTMTKQHAGALIIQPLFISNLGQGEKLAGLAIKNRLPTSSDGDGFAEAGGLMFYGPDQTPRFRRAAIYVDKILKGAKPADLPVEQPTKFELVINIKTAKQIRLTIPPNVLARADKVIR